MSPRPYRLRQRQENTTQTRARIIEAARDLLMSGDGFSRFSIDAVARHANVARMTVYHQFGAKNGLLEGLCDSLAAHAGIPISMIAQFHAQKEVSADHSDPKKDEEELLKAFQRADSLDTLNQYISCYSHYWNIDRMVMRRLHALAALDPDFEQVIQERTQRGQRYLRFILQRIHEQHGYPSPEAFEEMLNILYTLISFESFDTLAGVHRSIEDVTPIIQQLVYAALGLNSKQLHIQRTT